MCYKLRLYNKYFHLLRLKDEMNRRAQVTQIKKVLSSKNKAIRPNVRLIIIGNW